MVGAGAGTGCAIGAGAGAGKGWVIGAGDGVGPGAGAGVGTGDGGPTVAVPPESTKVPVFGPGSSVPVSDEAASGGATAASLA